jgi:glycosyltransferase involved in cell wall biosynthesis
MSSLSAFRASSGAPCWSASLDRSQDLLELPLRAGRYLFDSRLRAKAIDSLQRRWQSRRADRPGPAPDLPHLDWLLRKLDIAAPAPEVARRLGGFLTRRDVEIYRRIIEPLRVAALQPPNGAVRRSLDLEPAARAPLPRLRLLFVCGEFPDPFHGGGGRVSDFVKELGARHDVFVAAWRGRRRNRSAFRDLAPHCRELRGFCLEDLERGCAERILAMIGGRPADVVHYEWPRSLESFDRRLGRFHVYTHMDVVSRSLRMDLHRLEPLSPEWCARLALLPKMLGVEILEAARADLQITVTARDGEFLMGFRPDATYFVVNHGINPDEFDLPDRAPEPATVVFTGNFMHYPNQEGVHFFMQGIKPLVSAAVPGLRVLFVGANPPADILRYPDGRNVIVTGSVPDVRPYIQRASVCIAPLVSGAGLRTKVVQYAALGRPSVVTPVAAEGLLFSDGRDIVIAAEPAAFAARLTELLLEPARASAMGARARVKAHALYDNRRIVSDGLERIYRHLLAGPGASRR